MPLLLRLYVSRLREAGQPLHPRIDSEMARHLGYLNRELDGRDWFVGNDVTGADIQLSFVAQGGLRVAGRDTYPNLTRYVERIEARPAYRRAVDKHGA